ncbi:hypothetical protein GEMRC1_002346 [Eukaryota sp. GEM-RC1]
MILRGTKPNVFAFEATKSQFHDQSNGVTSFGYHIRLDSKKEGQLVANQDFSYSSGLSIVVELDESQFALVTEKRYKDTLVSKVGGVLGSVAGISSTLSFGLIVVEIIFHRKKDFFKKMFGNTIPKRLSPYENPLYLVAFELQTLEDEPEV